MDGRTIQGDFYRRGFNGIEKDDEVKGGGNSYTTEFRQYDARVGRWLSLDPLASTYPYNSPFTFVENSVLRYVDTKGDKIKPAGDLAKSSILPMAHNLSRIGLSINESGGYLYDENDKSKAITYEDFADMYKKSAKKAKGKDPYFNFLDEKQLQEHYSLYLGIRSEEYIEVQFTVYHTEENSSSRSNVENSYQGTKVSEKNSLNYSGTEAHKFFNEYKELKGELNKALSDALYKGIDYVGKSGLVSIKPTSRLTDAVYFTSEFINDNKNYSLLMIDVTKKTETDVSNTLSNSLNSVVYVKK